MRKALIVVDMQNDFITGSLANKDAQRIVYPIANYIKNFDGDVYCTLDTHTTDYLDTQEGKRLPVVHCVEETMGWHLALPILEVVQDKFIKQHKYVQYVIKDTFGSTLLGTYIEANSLNKGPYTDIEICGVCTDICVISNAMIVKAFLPEANIKILKDLCAGVTPESHEIALKAMEACQIDIVESEQ